MRQTARRRDVAAHPVAWPSQQLNVVPAELAPHRAADGRRGQITDLKLFGKEEIAERFTQRAAAPGGEIDQGDSLERPVCPDVGENCLAERERVVAIQGGGNLSATARVRQATENGVGAALLRPAREKTHRYRAARGIRVEI